MTTMKSTQATSWLKRTIGVNIKSDSVDLLGFDEISGRRFLRSVAGEALPSGAVERGNIKDASAVAAALETARRKAEPRRVGKNLPAVCALPEEKTFVRVIALPRMNDEKTAEAIKWEMEAYIPMSPQDMVYDWRSVPAGEDKSGEMKVLVIAAPRTVVADYCRVLKEASLSPAIMEPTSLAQIRALRGQWAEDESVMILSCDKRAAHLAVVVNGEVLLFTAGIPVGPDGFEADVSRSLGVSAVEAREIVSTEGIGSYLHPDPLFRALEPSLKLLTKELAGSRNFCETTLPLCGQISKVILVGPGAELKGLRSYLTSVLGLPVSWGDPWAATGMELTDYLPRLSREESLSRLTTIGLALKKITYEDFD
ncbi:MAG TPA: hypothetical protein ENJ77_00305 [Candidatus Moranbacteria bacterium]|nr:hypothetical protein [Candidatus Moranbacteria bacterium]